MRSSEDDMEWLNRAVAAEERCERAFSPTVPDDELRAAIEALGLIVAERPTK